MGSQLDNELCKGTIQAFWDSVFSQGCRIVIQWFRSLTPKGRLRNERRSFSRTLAFLYEEPARVGATLSEVELMKMKLDRMKIPHPDWFHQVYIFRGKAIWFNTWTRFTERLVDCAKRGDLEGACKLWQPPKKMEGLSPLYTEKWKSLSTKNRN